MSPDFDYAGNDSIHKDNAFKVGDRVKESLLGLATIIKVIESPLSSDWVLAYMIHTDKEPDKEYNGGNNKCLTFHCNLLAI